VEEREGEREQKWEREEKWAASLQLAST